MGFATNNTGNKGFYLSGLLLKTYVEALHDFDHIQLGSIGNFGNTNNPVLPPA
jgi:hypothetical protein